MEFKGFTIEAKKRGKDKDFSFENLEMSHQECYGGKITLEEIERKEDALSVRLTCSRCGVRRIIAGNDILKVVQTAIDGEERIIREEKEAYMKHLEVRVIQKI